MTARVQNAKVRADHDRSLAASFEIRNVSAEAWRPSGGFAISYRIFDPQTGTLIVDGPRLAPERDVAPGETRQFDLQLELPAEPGRYRVFVSAMQEDVCWLYERGAEFLLIDGAVDAGGAMVEGFRVATERTVGRERLLRSIRRAFTLPVEAVLRNRSLIRTMVRRDILARYRGSFGGAFWTILNPLILMLTYFFVFGVVLHTRFPSDPSRSGFALYFLAGMLPWLAVSEAVGRAPVTMLEYRNFVKKLVFPVETLPLNLVTAGLVSEVFGVALFVAGSYLAHGSVPASIIWLPALIVPQILLTAGLSWFLAALGVFVRDLAQINGFLLTLWFFLTPICYPETSLPGPALRILAKNPMFVLVRGYRDTLLEGRAPDFRSYWKLCVVSAVIFILGHGWFYKLRKSFADII
ncbi:MAG TPA: ABC transporter permease [Bryobacteraceae bacterium]|nr:ABC transporter permease [Bryobacteraceae bacterium]